MSYNKDFKHIRESLNNNTLTIFVGSGISRNSGCIEWWKIIDTFAEELNIKDKEPYYKNFYNEKGNVEFRLDESFDKMIKIPQIYYNEFGKDVYYEFLEKLFSKKYTPHLIHTFLIKLRPKNFITTNYDTLIEDTANEYLEAFDIITCDSDIKPMNNDRLIIKMHGDLKNKNLILKEDDYLDYSKSFKLTETLVKGIVATNITLFIGYSLSDYNVKQIIADIPHDNKSKPRAYFVNLDDDYSELEEKYYSKKGIKVLYANKFLNTKAKLTDDKGANLQTFLNFIFEESLNESLVKEALEILEPYRHFYLGRNGLQTILSKFDLKTSKDDFNLYHILNFNNNIGMAFFSDIEKSPQNFNRFKSYLKFNNVEGIMCFHTNIWNNSNSKRCSFRFIHEYDSRISIEKALQLYYLGNYVESYRVFSTIFKEAIIKKDYISIGICAFNIRKMNYFSDYDRHFKSAQEIPIQELDFIMNNVPRNNNYLNKLYSHEVLSKYTNDVLHATLKISKKPQSRDIEFLNMTLISFINFFTFNKITLDERLYDVNDIIYFAILKILQSDNEILLEDYHIYLIYIFFNSNLLKNLKTDYSKPIKLKNLDIFIHKLMKDWDLQLLNPISHDRFYYSLNLLQLLDLDLKNSKKIKEKIKSFEPSIIKRYSERIDELAKHLNKKKPAN